MCYIETMDFANVNKKFVRITNPTVGLYFSVLVEVLKQVRLKNKFDPATGEFKLNRAFITSETGIATTDQKYCDQILTKLGIVTVNSTNADKLIVNMKRYMELLTDTSLQAETILSPTAKLTRAEKQAAKENGLIDLYAAQYSELVNREVADQELTAIKKLIRVYYSKGVVKKEQWEPIFKILNSCTNDPASIVELVEYVNSTNYVSIPAAIDSFMKKHAPTATKLGTTQRKCTGVSDIKF